MSKTVSSLELRQNHISKPVYHNNIIPFPSHRVQQKFEPQIETEYSLSQEPHLMIVTLGALIGGTFAIFCMYHIDSLLINLTLFAVLPFFTAYLMRKVYIRTCLQHHHAHV